MSVAAHVQTRARSHRRSHGGTARSVAVATADPSLQLCWSLCHPLHRLGAPRSLWPSETMLRLATSRVVARAKRPAAPYPHSSSASTPCAVGAPVLRLLSGSQAAMPLLGGVPPCPRHRESTSCPAPAWVSASAPASAAPHPGCPGTTIRCAAAAPVLMHQRFLHRQMPGPRPQPGAPESPRPSGTTLQRARAGELAGVRTRAWLHQLSRGGSTPCVANAPRCQRPHRRPVATPLLCRGLVALARASAALPQLPGGTTTRSAVAVPPQRQLRPMHRLRHLHPPRRVVAAARLHRVLVVVAPACVVGLLLAPGATTPSAAAVLAAAGSSCGHMETSRVICTVFIAAISTACQRRRTSRMQRYWMYSSRRARVGPRVAQCSSGCRQ